MKQISIKQFVLGSKMVSKKICMNLAMFFLITVIISSILILPSCLVSTYGKSSVKLNNDEVQFKIYRNAFAKQEQVEKKLKELIDQELSANNYVDFVLLDQDYVAHRVKFFKTIQDKVSFLGNYSDQKKYLIFLINSPNGQYSEIAKQLLAEVDAKEQIDIERREKLIRLTNEKIKVNMTYNQVDAILELNKIKYQISFENTTKTTSTGGLTYNEKLLIEGRVYLEFKDGILIKVTVDK